MAGMNESGWGTEAKIERVIDIARSYERAVGKPLAGAGRSVAGAERPEERHDYAEVIFDANFVLVSHGTEDDPVLNYGNAAALKLWSLSFDELCQMPSRLTAEPMHRDERAEMLARVSRDGFIDDYAGVRIASTGRRFRIDQATVWNVFAADGSPAGQAAMFDLWEWLD